jgi:hypothetical protein
VLSAGIFLGALGDLGERTTREVASAHGWTLTVECPAIAPWIGESSAHGIGTAGWLRRPGRYLAFDRAYWDQVDVAISPPPLGVAADADTVRLTFSIPLGRFS